MLSKRQRTVLQVLKEQKDYITIDQIAKKVSFSPKTIRNDLSQIGQFLSEHQLGKIQAKPRKGIRLFITEEKWDKLQSIWQHHDAAVPAEERKCKICRILFQNKTVHMADLEKQLYLGRSGVEKALNDVQPWLESRNIKLHKVRGKGLQIECSEFSKRLAYLDLYTQSQANKNLGKGIMTGSNSLDEIALYFNGFNADGVVCSLNETEKKYGFHFEYHAGQQLFFYFPLSLLSAEQVS
jgi:transcriptional antiterminator